MAIIIRKSNPVEKVLIAKWLVNSRTSKRQKYDRKTGEKKGSRELQEAQAKMQQALVADANAQKMIAEARGDSAKAVIAAAGRAQAEVIEAQGLAQAMKLKQQQLTPLYVDFVRAQNWDGKLPGTVLGGNTSVLLGK